ncbi:MAG: DUF1343 domain-containing protein [Bacteroidales bacterium]|nr:DUF1343 domain-containing protein [Bacteroidales bacterium]MBQ4286560.1 DUF1343 domain-containing protein [Bacteroidales bacterium]
MKNTFLLFSLLLLAAIPACAGAPAGETTGATEVRTGIEVLRDSGFKGLEGKRVGLVTNPSGVDRNLRSTIDILHDAPGVNLVALFGPEHGVRGDAYAGGHVADSKDPSTGLPVYSIYGATREPTDEMLRGIDVMVYDIQDVGTRSYTFISTLGLVMRACARNDIEVMVLDRPNPLGGNKVEGCVVENGFFSFVGEFAIPYVYGLTVGELARMINEEGMNRGQKGNQPPLKCRLTVVPMEGWHRDMIYDDTRLPWVLPSPNIPYPETAICYPSSGICGEFSGFLNIGIGYTLPFATFAAEWVDADRLKARLDSYDLPGVDFRVIHYKPFFGGSAGKLLHGVQFFYTDYPSAVITLTQFYVMQAVNELWPGHNPMKSLGSGSMLDKICGTDYVRLHFAKEMKVSEIESYWMKDVETFKTLSRKYYIYY